MSAHVLANMPAMSAAKSQSSNERYSVMPCTNSVPIAKAQPLARTRDRMNSLLKSLAECLSIVMKASTGYGANMRKCAILSTGSPHSVKSVEG